MKFSFWKIKAYRKDIFSLINAVQKTKTMNEKYPNTEFFLLRIFPHSDWIRRDTIYSYSVRIRENTDQKNSVFGHFSRSANHNDSYWIIVIISQNIDKSMRPCRDFLSEFPWELKHFSSWCIIFASERSINSTNDSIRSL